MSGALATPPWHLWGSSQTSKLGETSAGVGAKASQNQLVRIAYKRPETWKWFVAVQVLEKPAGGGQLTVDFELTLGVGRSQITVPVWGRISIVLGVPPAPLVYATQWPAPSPDPAAPVGYVPVTNTVSASDIQLVAKGLIAPTIIGDTCTFETHAYFAPVHHARPEWWKDRFNGNETDGH